MRRLNCIAALFAVSLLIIGCTGTVSKNTKFDEGSSTSIIVVGIEDIVSDGTGFSVAFLPPTKSDTNPAKAFSIGDTGGWAFIQGKNYFVAEIQPGTYVLTWLKTTRVVGFTNYNTTHLFCDKTLEFTVEPGTVNYVANFSFKRNGRLQTGKSGKFSRASFTRKPDRLDEARLALTEYPGISPEIDKVPARLATFKCPKGL